MKWLRAELKAPDFKRELFADGPEPEARTLRWRQYGTGAGIAALLDRLNVPWHDRINMGEFPDQILRSTVGLRRAEVASLAKEGMSAFGDPPASAR